MHIEALVYPSKMQYLPTSQTPGYDLVGHGAIIHS